MAQDDVNCSLCITFSPFSAEEDLTKNFQTSKIWCDEASLVQHSWNELSTPECNLSIITFSLISLESLQLYSKIGSDEQVKHHRCIAPILCWGAKRNKCIKTQQKIANMKTKPRKQENKQARMCGNGATQSTHFSRLKIPFFSYWTLLWSRCYLAVPFLLKLQEFFLFYIQCNQATVYRKQVLPGFFSSPWQFRRALILTDSAIWG